MGETVRSWAPDPARCAAGQPGRRLRPAARGAGHRRRGRRRGHPPAAPGWPATSTSPSRGRIVSYFEGNEERRTPELVERPARRRTWSRWSPTAACRASPTPATGWSGPRWTPASPVTAAPGPERRHHRPGPVRPALRPVLLRGLPAPHRPARRRPACARSPPSSARWSSSRRRTGSPPRSPTWPPRSAPTGRPRSAAS